MTMDKNNEQRANVSDYTTVPEGVHSVKVGEVRVGQTRAGWGRWSLSLIVDGGDLDGRLAAWDAIVWSPRGRHRAREILLALGAGLDPMAEHLVGLKATVTVRRAEYISANGTTVIRNEIPYNGYTE